MIHLVFHLATQRFRVGTDIVPRRYLGTALARQKIKRFRQRLLFRSKTDRQNGRWQLLKPGYSYKPILDCESCGTRFRVISRSRYKTFCRWELHCSRCGSRELDLEVFMSDLCRPFFEKAGLITPETESYHLQVTYLQQRRPSLWLLEFKTYG
jgi:hypothetical protein